MGGDEGERKRKRRGEENKESKNGVGKTGPFDSRSGNSLNLIAIIYMAYVYRYG